MFGRKARTLHQEHASAHALAQNALSVFHKLAGDLRAAAEDHATVAVSAQQQINDLSTLRDSAGQAAEDALRKADAISALVG